MSKKSEKLAVKSAQIVPKTRLINGMEVPDHRSLVASCDLRPITMGERVMRYMRSPRLRDDLVFDDDLYDPDDDVFHDDDDRMMSPHEDRAKAYLDMRKKRIDEIERKKHEEAEKKRLEDDEKFRAAVRAVKDDIAPTA